jgi:alpha-amylase
MKKKILTLATLFLITFGSRGIAKGAELPKYESFTRDIYNNCIIVYPKDDRGGYIVARGIASEALKNDKVKIEIYRNDEVKEEIIASKNVIMIGNSLNNNFIKKIEGNLPAKVTPTSVIVGDKSYNKDYGLSYIYPNLYNTKNKMIFIMGNNENALKMPDFKGYDLSVSKGIKDILPFHYKEVASAKFDQNWKISKIEDINPKLLETGENSKLKVGKLKKYDFPEWAKGKVMYQIFVRSFYDTDGDGIGDLNGITKKLDYIKSLGVDMIWLTPIFDSPSNHGYDTRDYFTVNKNFGTMEDFENLIKEAKSRNIEIILDIAFNHASRFEQHFIDAHGNPNSNFDKWFYFSNIKNTIYHDWYYKFDEKSRDSVEARMPAWNTNNPEVVDFHMEVLKFWMDPNQDGDTSDGVGGFRFDVVKGPSHEYWKIIRQKLKAINPNILIVGEAWVDTKNQKEYFDDEMDTIFDFSLQGALTTGLTKDIFANMETEKNEFPEHAVFSRFLSNHDLDRMPTYVSVEKLKQMSTFIYTLKGIPVLYYGDEIGQKGTAENGNDNGRRRPMEWYKNKTGEGMTRWTSLASKTPDGISVEEQDKVEGSLLEHFRKLAKIRKENINIFAEGKADFMNTFENEKMSRRVVAYTVTGKGKRAIVLLNYGKETTYKIETGEILKGKEFIEVLSGKDNLKISDSSLTITLGNLESRIYIEK